MKGHKGIEKAKSLTLLVDELVDVLEAAKKDDGKISARDLLNQKVWAEGVEFLKVAKSTTENFQDLRAELSDLDLLESLELVQHYTDTFEKLYKVVKA